jgi:hypothetical protein
MASNEGHAYPPHLSGPPHLQDPQLISLINSIVQSKLKETEERYASEIASQERAIQEWQEEIAAREAALHQEIKSLT